MAMPGDLRLFQGQQYVEMKQIADMRPRGMDGGREGLVGAGLSWVHYPELHSVFPVCRYSPG